MELIIKKCPKCGATVEVLNDCTCQNCGILCCGEKMVVQKPNSVDASFEKHLPKVQIENHMMKVWVEHVMEPEHYIEWIGVLTDNKLTKVFFGPGDVPEAVFHWAPNSKVFASCNKHGLWETDVE